VVNQTTFRQLCNGRFPPNLVTKRSSVSRRAIRKDIFENFHFRGHLPPNSEIENRSNRHFTQSRLQVTWCTAEILFTPCCSPGCFRGRSTFLYDVRLRSYGASHLPNFRILAYFPHTKPIKRTYDDQPTVQGLHRRMIRSFPCDSRRSKGVSSGTGDFLRLLVVGELGTPKLAQIFAYGKWLYPYRMQLHGASDLDRRCLKTHNSKVGCTFPPNIFAPPPKITRKLHSGGPFNAKPIIQIALRKSHRYRQVLGCVKFFSATGIRGAQGPLV